MPEQTQELRVQVIDDEITVTLPGSHYSATYYRLEHLPALLPRRNSSYETDKRAQMSVSEFLARAWKIANEKAKELGWVN